MQRDGIELASAEMGVPVRSTVWTKARLGHPLTPHF